MRPIYQLVFAATLFLIAAVARAEDVFYSVPLSDLKITEGKVPAPTTQPRSYSLQYIEPRVVIDGPGDALVLSSGTRYDRWNIFEHDIPVTVTVRVSTAREINGSLYLAKSDGAGAERIRFTIPADASKPSARDDFYSAQLRQSVARVNENAPGSAWFRYRAAVATKTLGPGNPTTQRAQIWNGNRSRARDLDETFSLFSGGRAVSENLQFDRELRMRNGPESNELTEPVSEIRGITTAEIDWTELNKDLHPAVDPLANVIPIDQHAILLPSFEAAINLSNLADKQGTPVLSVADVRAEDSLSRERYEKQLGLSLNLLSKLLGPTMVDAVALTGSDPSYRLGTDVAVIFHSPNAPALRDLLLAKINFANLLNAPKRETGKVAGLSYSSVHTDDRAVSSFIAQAGDVVIVTNSLKELERIANVVAKKSPALSSAPEYTFFRDRYKRGEADETAFVMLTDATIRRWCGAQWRIADSRRTRAAAALARLQAQWIDQHKIGDATAEVDLGTITQVGDQVISSIYGSYQMMTPIVELNVDRCSPDEKLAYERWRDTYQSNWRWAFDPIAAKITNTNQQLALDLSIRPLIAATDYREFVDLCSGVSLDQYSGDPHDAMVHFALALNMQSQSAKQWLPMGSSMLGGKVDALSWIGKSAAIYLDSDPGWLKPNDSASLYHMPIALFVESNDALKLAAFLTLVHSWSDQSAPNLATWSTLKHGEKSYTKIEAAAGMRRDPRASWAIFYTATGDGLTISLSEEVINARSMAQRTGDTGAPTTRLWLGESLAFQCDRRVFDLVKAGSAMGTNPWTRQAQERSWSNLPILNEWKRLFPNEDPLVVHERFFATRLVDPAGGSYVWNEKWQTMESSVFGHPGEPRVGPELPPFVNEFEFLNAGLTFENAGLRARVQLNRATGENR